MKIKTKLQSGNFFHCHKIRNTLRFGSKLFPSSDETTNPKIQLTKNTRTHANTIHTRGTKKKKTNTSKDINPKYHLKIVNICPAYVLFM
jgi:hypothetical protein